MEYIALSKKEAARYEPEGNEVCISIVSPESSHPDLSDEFWATLHLKFHDVDEWYFKWLEETGEEEGPQVEPFKDWQAEKIVAMWNYWHDSEPLDRFVVHCEAGVSRSVGVVRALQELDGQDTPEGADLRSCGNIYVRNKILRRLFGSCTVADGAVRWRALWGKSESIYAVIHFRGGRSCCGLSSALWRPQSRRGLGYSARSHSLLSCQIGSRRAR